MKLKPHRVSKEERELTRILKEEILKEVNELIIKDIKQFAQKGTKMTNVFADQKKFMIAGDQAVDQTHIPQYEMYLNLIKEETKELQDAVDNHDYVEQLDALIDILVVTVGAIHSLGADGEGAWNEVMSTNFAKIDPETGKVRKREDGKILKPAGWKAPELEQFLNKTKG